MRDPLALRVKRPKAKPKPRRHRTREEEIDQCCVYITRKIKRGDFDPNKQSDLIKARVAKANGVIDDDYNILKEEYLLCKTKRHKY